MGSGSGAQELAPNMPLEAEPRDGAENLGMGHQTESGNVCWLRCITEYIWEVRNGCWSDSQAESQAGRGKRGQKVCNDGVTLAYQGVINKYSWGQTAF